MTTAIRSEATRSVVSVNGVDVLSIKPDGQLEVLTTAGMTDTHIPLMKQFAAITTTSGTAHDQLNIPSWAKKITVSFNGVSTNGTSPFLVQVGAGSVDSTGYASTGSVVDTGVSVSSSTAGFIVRVLLASNAMSLVMTLTRISGNAWVCGYAGANTSSASLFGGGSKSLAAVLDRIRLTTANGTDVFDAGSFSVLVEG